MKTLTLMLMMSYACFSNLAGQTVSLTFTASYNGGHQPLDSVAVLNLTRGGDTTLYGGDTVLVLEYGTGMDDPLLGPPNQLFMYPITPNPVTKTATIHFYLPKDAMVTVRAHDLLGREIALIRQWLTFGDHEFAFTPCNESIYLLSVEASGYKQVQRLVSLNGSGSDGRITYTGARGGLNAMRTSFATMPWAPGDQLRFIGYSANGIDTLTGQPIQSTTYTFLYSSGTCPPTVTDINGNVYNTVLIGSQCWMKENLKVRNYRNGTPIPNVTNGTTWTGLTSGARCWYNNDSAAYAATYGALYNWYAVDNANGLCPTGWHVPSDLEWQTLEMQLGMTQAQANAGGMRGTDEGGKMKEAGLAHWNSPNTGATNSSGFTALPGGNRYSNNGSFYSIGSTGNWWPSTAYSATDAWGRDLYKESSLVYRGTYKRRNGFSVRCIRD